MIGYVALLFINAADVMCISQDVKAKIDTYRLLKHNDTLFIPTFIFRIRSHLQYHQSPIAASTTSL